MATKKEYCGSGMDALNVSFLFISCGCTTMKYIAVVKCGNNLDVDKKSNRFDDKTNKSRNFQRRKLGSSSGM